MIYVLNPNADGNCSGTYLNYRSWNVIHTLHFLSRTSVRWEPSFLTHCSKRFWSLIIRPTSCSVSGWTSLIASRLLSSSKFWGLAKKSGAIRSGDRSGHCTSLNREIRRPGNETALRFRTVRAVIPYLRPKYPVASWFFIGWNFKSSCKMRHTSVEYLNAMACVFADLFGLLNTDSLTRAMFSWSIS